MLNSKKIFKLTILSVLILAMLVFAFASCKTDDGKQTPGENPTQNQDDEENGGDSEKADAGPKYKADYLPDMDFDGYVFRIAVYDDPGEGALKSAADREQETGDTVDDAMYRRNRIIEERYNVIIKQIGFPQWTGAFDLFNKSIAGGTDDFDLCTQVVSNAWNVALQGKIVPIYQLPYCDITQPWYCQNTNEELSIMGKLFFAYSDEALNMFEQSEAVCFNKGMAAEFEFEDIYTLVDEGKWTVDRFFEMSKAVTQDMNGDGIMNDEDRYGILSEWDMLYANFWRGAGIKLIEKDPDGIPYFNAVGNQRLFDALENAYDNLFGGEKIFYDLYKDKPTKYAADDRQSTRMMFQDGHGLFYVTYIGNVQHLRGMDKDYGLIPFPKYDEAQENYYSRCYEGLINLPPIHAENLERTSIIMEALAIESKNYTIPAYYEIAFKNKHARDEESERMMDLIYDARSMDLGDTIWRGNVTSIFDSLMHTQKNTFASSAEKNDSVIQKIIGRAIEAVEALEN